MCLILGRHAASLSDLIIPRSKQCCADPTSLHATAHHEGSPSTYQGSFPGAMAAAYLQCHLMLYFNVGLASGSDLRSMAPE